MELYQRLCMPPGVFDRFSRSIAESEARGLATNDERGDARLVAPPEFPCASCIRMVGSFCRQLGKCLNDEYRSAKFDLGVESGSPLAVGAGQTGETLAVQCEAPFDLIDYILLRRDEPVIVFEGALLAHASEAISTWATSTQYGPPQNGLSERLNRAVRIRAVRETEDRGAEGWAIGRAWYVDTVDSGVRSGRERLSC